MGSAPPLPVSRSSVTPRPTRYTSVHRPQRAGYGPLSSVGLPKFRGYPCWPRPPPTGPLLSFLRSPPVSTKASTVPVLGLVWPSPLTQPPSPPALWWLQRGHQASVPSRLCPLQAAHGRPTCFPRAESFSALWKELRGSAGGPGPKGGRPGRARPEVGNFPLRPAGHPPGHCPLDTTGRSWLGGLGSWAGHPAGAGGPCLPVIITVSSPLPCPQPWGLVRQGGHPQSNRRLK